MVTEASPLMWRWVRDARSSSGDYHAVPADFESPTLYTVCMRRLDGRTVNEQQPSQTGELLLPCIECRKVIRFLASADNGEADHWPTTTQLSTEYRAGASLTQLCDRHHIREPVLRYLLGLTNTPIRRPGAHGDNEAQCRRQVLLLLATEPERELRGVEIASQLGFTHGVTSNALHRLLAAGLLARRKSPEDNRRRLYRLTEAGAAQALEADELPAQDAPDSGPQLATATDLV